MGILVSGSCKGPVFLISGRSGWKGASSANHPTSIVPDCSRSQNSGDHRQTALLNQANPGHHRIWRRPSNAQAPQQSDRRGTPADAEAGKDHGPVQVPTPSAKVSCCPRPDQHELPPPPLSSFRSFLPPRPSRWLCSQTTGLNAGTAPNCNPRPVTWQCLVSHTARYAGKGSAMSKTKFIEAMFHNAGKDLRAMRR